MATIVNELFFVVLPTIQVGGQRHGLTEQMLTLLPDRNFATRFFPDEVGGYIALFNNRLKYLTGGHVKEYVLHQDMQQDGRLVIRVVQYVS